MSWILMGTLTVGLLGAASSAGSGSLDCCARGAGRPGGMQHCQWMIPAACCDESLSVTGSNAVPKPAVTIRFPSSLARSPETPLSTPGHAWPASHRAGLATVVLRL